MTEVSELSNEGAVSVAGRTVPSCACGALTPLWKFRPVAHSAMAGLIQEQTKQQINGLPV